MAGMKEKSPARESREIKHGERTWFAGEDLKVVQPVTLQPRTVTFVDVHLPTQEKQPFIADGSAQRLVSTRSMLAQLNTEVMKGSEELVAQAYLRDQETCKIGMHNHADQAITLDEGTGIGKLARWSKDIVTGDVLKRLVSSDSIKIEGEKGKDWEYYYDPKTAMPIGILMPLDPDYRRYLPKSDEKIHITPDISGITFRHQIDQWLQPVNGNPSDIEISHTRARLYLPSGINGFIDSSLEHPGNIYHINSPFLYGDRTGIDETTIPWPIRTEIIKPGKGEPQPDSIVVTFSLSDPQIA